MGMYDHIIEVPEIKCGTCDSELSCWQSKDDRCLLQEVPYWKVNQFYTHCRTCFDFITVTYNGIRKFEDYKVTQQEK